MDGPIQPHPSNHQPPKILANHGPHGDRVRVEYSLPGLRRVTVTVPYQRWREGGHAPVGQALADMLGELDLQQAKRSGKVPGT